MTSTTSTPTSRISIEPPHRWHTRADHAHGIVMAAGPRVSPGGVVPPELVLRAAPVQQDLDGWRRTALGELATTVEAFDLEDDDEFDLGTARVRYHRFAHRYAGSELLSEQWAWLVDGLGVTLTGTVAREQYLVYCDLFEEVAASVEVRPAA